MSSYYHRDRGSRRHRNRNRKRNRSRSRSRSPVAHKTRWINALYVKTPLDNDPGYLIETAEQGVRYQQTLYRIKIDVISVKESKRMQDGVEEIVNAWRTHGDYHTLLCSPRQCKLVFFLCATMFYTHPLTEMRMHTHEWIPYGFGSPNHLLSTFPHLVVFPQPDDSKVTFELPDAASCALDASQEAVIVNSTHSITRDLFQMHLQNCVFIETKDNRTHDTILYYLVHWIASFESSDVFTQWTALGA